MTTPPVDEAAERLRAALADVEAGRKAKLFPADVRALLDHYDRRGETAGPDKAAMQPELADEDNRDNARLREVTDSLKGIRDALDMMKRPGFSPRLQEVLIPFARAILGQLNREIDEMKQERVADDATKEADD